MTLQRSPCLINDTVCTFYLLHLKCPSFRQDWLGTAFPLGSSLLLIAILLLNCEVPGRLILERILINSCSCSLSQSLVYSLRVRELRLKVRGRWNQAVVPYAYILVVPFEHTARHIVDSLITIQGLLGVMVSETIFRSD